MAYSEDKINAPVSIYDIQKFFGLTSPDLGTLITDAQINPWAKYKPVRNAYKATDLQFDFTNNKWLSTATWWQASDGKCGFSIDTFPSAGSIDNSTSFLYKLKNGLLSWVYQKPTGGASQPFRLQDFARYWKDAIPAVGTCGVEEGGTVWVERTGQATIMQIDYEAPSDTELNLFLKDFTIDGVSLTEYYLGILMWRRNGNYKLVTTAAKMGAATAVSIRVEIGYSDVGDWAMLPFLCSSQIRQDGTIPAATYLSASIVTPLNFKVRPTSQYIEMFVGGMWNTANTVINFALSVTNNTASQKSIEGVTVYVYSTASASDDPSTGSLVAQKTLTGCTVAADDTYEYSEDSIAVTRNDSLFYWVTARPTDSTIYQNSYQMVEESDEPLEL